MALATMKSYHAGKKVSMPEQSKWVNNNAPEKYLTLSFRHSCHGGDTDVEFAGELFRNLSLTFLKRRKTGNPLAGGKEEIELSRMTKRCSNRQALRDFPKTLEKITGNETGIEELSTADTVLKRRKRSRRGNIKDSRQLSRRDVEKILTAEKSTKDSDVDVNKREWSEISGILDRSVCC